MIHKRTTHTLGLLVILAMVLFVFSAAAEEQTQSPLAWEKTLASVYERIAENQIKYAPRVTTLPNGVQIQRTPADTQVFNTSVLKADERGCAACHTDLAQTLLNCKVFNSAGYYRHFEFVNDMGIETTLRQCYICHVTQDSWLPSLQTLMHGIHDNDMFKQVGGDCWSCHYTNETTGEMEQWDLVKYKKLHGITGVANVEGDFSYDTDKVSDSLFALNWMSRATDQPRLAKFYSGETPNPDEDGIYDEWTITVTGEVDKEVTFTLSELMENAPAVTKLSAFQCAINPLGGPFVGNVEITGTPIRWLLEQAGVKDGADIFYCGFEENMSYGHRISDLAKHEAYLVYQINGKPLAYNNGYPVLSWFEAGVAADGRKQCTTINVVKGSLAENNPSYLNYTTHGPFSDSYDNVPNIGLCELSDGQIIKAGEPYTFEGYASGFRAEVNVDEYPNTVALNETQEPEAIAAIEISMDQGATWSRFETPKATADKWVYWYFTWTPPEEGSYVVSVRSIRADGMTTAYPLEKLISVQ